MSSIDQIIEKSVRKEIEARGNQPVTNQPNAVPPVTVVQTETPLTTYVPIETRFCEFHDKCWWSYCWFAILFTNFAELCMDLKLGKNMRKFSSILWGSPWLLCIILELTSIALICYGIRKEVLDFLFQS